MTQALRAYMENLARDRLRDDLRVTETARVVGSFMRCEIGSAFQPVARLADAMVTGCRRWRASMPKMALCCTPGSSFPRRPAATTSSCSTAAVESCMR